ncbi:MAG: beta-ketoacyl-[acyl-carrier-protein] synthase family protein [Chthoniobacterales bacterium]
MADRNRVVVTGMGVIAPNGTGLKEFWRSLAAGESGIGPITRFDASNHRSRIAGEVTGFDPLDYLARESKPKRLARHTQFAYAAAQMALTDARFDPKVEKLSSVLPVCIGVSSSAFDVIENGIRDLHLRGANRISSSMVRNCQPQAAALLIAQKLGVETQASTISSACNSGIDAIASAAAMISTTDIEIAIAGGADAPVTPLAMASLSAAGLSSFANRNPATASRPYDSGSDSGVISEGSAVVILENLDHALARGAKPYLEVTGYAAQMDSDPDDPFDGLEATMRLAMANAGRKTNEIDYICSYGPGHPLLDAAEVRMIRRVFAPISSRIPVSSIKGVTGNPLSAAGPMQVISCALSFQHGLIPPTANHDWPLPDCNLDFVPQKARKALLNCALINVRGLGGGNSSMVVERVEIS